jgi:DNA-binding transcriptional MerR regulator
MAITNVDTLSIGELARRTGVPVKTIRFYSDQGLLPPAEVTGAGYRRYSEQDVLRLETIRTLRAAGFDMATIRDVIDRNLQPDEAIRIQVEALAVQERTIRRQRMILERALQRGDVPGHPERGRALALLSAAERTAFLRHQLETGITDVPVDQSWWTDFLGAAVEEIPDDLDDDQLSAWIELVDMTGDPSFAEAIRRTAEPFWSDLLSTDGLSLARWQQHQQAMVENARNAVRTGIAPESDEGLLMIDAWVADIAGAVGGEERARGVVGHMVQTHDPRLGSYWELIATVKRMPYDRELQEAWNWILAAMSRWSGEGGASGEHPTGEAKVR